MTIISNLLNACNYKNKIISILLKNDDFITLMNPINPPNERLTKQDMLLGGTWLIDGKKYEEQGQLFDHDFIDDTTTLEKAFVLVETDIDLIRNDIITDFNLYICVFTPKSMVRITNNTTPSINDVEKMGYKVGYYGNLVDALCVVIDKILNGNEKIKGIGDIEPTRKGFGRTHSPNNKYYGKLLTYKISNLNSDGGDYCEF